MTDQALPPAGWHPDPHGGPGLRWWDGTAWSEHVQVVAAAAPTFDPEVARHLADHAVARYRFNQFAEDTDEWSAELLDRAEAHRSAVRWAADDLAHRLGPGEGVAHIALSADYLEARGTAWIVGLALALTTARAVAVTAHLPVGGDAAPSGVEVHEMPLSAVEITRKRMSGPREGFELEWNRRSPTRFRLTTRSLDVVAKLQAFVSSPSVLALHDVSDLAQQLALPRLDPGAAAPDWYPDPTTGGQGGYHRWWDGFAWTARVARRGSIRMAAGGGATTFGSID